MTQPIASTRTLSKSDFKLARTCDAKLYFRENRYQDQGENDPYLSLLRNGGFMVEALAEAKRPDGIRLEYGRDVTGDFARTCELLSRDIVTVFQATLIAGRRHARVDILEKNGNTIRLIEVKTKSIDGAAHFANLATGGKGLLRGSKKLYDVIEKWRASIEDVAYQVLVLGCVFPNAIIHPALLLVDKSKRSPIDNLPRLFDLVRSESRDGTERTTSAQFIGTPGQLTELDLLVEIDVSQEVALVRDEVEAEAGRFEAILDATWDPARAVRGAKCKECEFRLEGDDTTSGYSHCWGALAYVKPHALELFNIGTVKDVDGSPLIESLVRGGSASLFDIPKDRLVKKDGTVGPQAQQQLRQIHYTRSGETWLGEQLRPKLEKLTCPFHFIDFEASRIALPYHAGMRPYGLVAFQWSCHIVESPGTAPTHREWLNTAELWPNASFVRALRQVIGDSAPVLTWSPYEGSSLREISRELASFGADDPELVAWIANVVNNRIVDLHDWAKNDFYHPGMRGRTSIKVVLDALWKSDAMMREQFTKWTGLDATESEDPYHALPPLEINGLPQDVREGTGAIRAYEAMMYGVEKNDEAAKRAWGGLLLQYCKLDTLSMVMIFEHWRRATGVASSATPR